MGLWDDVKNGIDGKNWESRDIEGIYIIPGRYPIKSRPNFDLFFILPNGKMKVIPEAHYSWDTGGENIFKMAIVNDGRVVDIEDMRR